MARPVQAVPMIGALIIAALAIAAVVVLVVTFILRGEERERIRQAEMEKPLVLVWVEGKSHVVTAGPGHAKRLYAEIGGLSGLFLSREGKLLGDYDPIDIKGGEGFGLVRYK